MAADVDVSVLGVYGAVLTVVFLELTQSNLDEVNPSLIDLLLLLVFVAYFYKVAKLLGELSLGPELLETEDQDLWQFLDCLVQ